MTQKKHSHEQSENDILRRGAFERMEPYLYLLPFFPGSGDLYALSRRKHGAHVFQAGL